jgi:hypothetical protein
VEATKACRNSAARADARVLRTVFLLFAALAAGFFAPVDFLVAD